MIVAVMTYALAGTAQSDGDYIEITRSVMKTEKKAAIADIMQLSEEESKIFWPLYNEYSDAMYKVQDMRVDIIQDYSENFDKMTDEKADELWNKSMAYESQILKLEKQYYKKFKKVLPTGKVVRFFQAENKIETMINAQLALEIPLVETK